ncbi:MAG TPA: hypothetical protein VFQ71_13050 [Gaiellales bacterium]|jgi:hypothetical protein|nr:hypothetical protein [Gaiellales bacterium]
MQTTAPSPTSSAAGSPAALLRWAPLSGIAAVVFFAVGVVASSPPGTGASDSRWTAAYAASHDAGHITTGVCLVLSGLMFVLFTAELWGRIAGREPAGRPSPVPLAAAAVTAACMSVGGVLMAAPSAVVSGGGPVPGADVLRLCNNTGFAMVAIPGMLAAAVAVTALSIQGRRAALFGGRLQVFGFVVALALLASLAFIPILAWLLWLVVLAVYQLRTPVAEAGR